MAFDYPAGLVWFRRDLRAHDHAALHHASRRCERVYGAFVFDRAILDGLPRADRRVEFIHGSVKALQAAFGGHLLASHAHAAEEIPRLARELGVQAVFANRDYEPGAVARDERVARELATSGIAFHTFKDQVVFERRDVVTQQGQPYSVFTPYKNAWLAKVSDDDLAALEVPAHALAPPPLDTGVPSLGDLGFERTDLEALGVVPGEQGAAEAFRAFLSRMGRYRDQRDFPALDSTSRLSVHLRFGTVSIRELARTALARAQDGDEGAATWLSELVWRDFFFQVLANFDVADESGMGRNFRREYDRIQWEQGAGAEASFVAWCEGRTGYPIVDAAMRQLLATGFMHNRLRMVAASFLVKDLGIDWRRGERFFAEKLLDYDLAANNGGWQWAASTGCDAQPYFRIFNPASQQAKFDPQGEFVGRWLGNELQPMPIVDHDEARAKTLARFGAARKNGA